jgi:hypothetical protein
LIRELPNPKRIEVKSNNPKASNLCWGVNLDSISDRYLNIVYINTHYPIILKWDLV